MPSTITCWRAASCATRNGSYFHRLTGGDYGPDYVHERLRVGLAQQRIGLEPKWYIGAYRNYLAEMIPLLSARFDGDAERLSAALNAVLKVVGFDMGLALDTYAHAGQRSVLQSQNYLQQVIDGMPAGLLVVDALPRPFHQQRHERHAGHPRRCARRPAPARDPDPGRGAGRARDGGAGVGRAAGWGGGAGRRPCRRRALVRVQYPPHAPGRRATCCS
jgi:hypothetical protein